MLSQNLEGCSNYASDMLILVYHFIKSLALKYMRFYGGEEGLAKSIHLFLKLRNSYVVSILNGCHLPKMAFSYSKEK